MKNKFPIVLPPMPKKPQTWKGSKIFSKPYWITAVLGHKGTGKSTLTYNLLRYFASKKTIVIFIVPTFYNDDTFIAMRKYLDEKNISWLAYTDVRDENGVDVVDIFMKVNARQEEESDSEPEEKTPDDLVKECPCKFGDEKEEAKKKKKKKKAPPNYLFITDDLTDDNRAKSMVRLAKKCRHFRCKMIISTQSVVDIPPQLHSQIDYYALFRGFNQDSLHQLYASTRSSSSVSIMLSLTVRETVSTTFYSTIGRNSNRTNNGE